MAFMTNVLAAAATYAIETITDASAAIAEGAKIVGEAAWHAGEVAADTAYHVTKKVVEVGAAVVCDHRCEADSDTRLILPLSFERICQETKQISACGCRSIAGTTEWWTAHSHWDTWVVSC